MAALIGFITIVIVGGFLYIATKETPPERDMTKLAQCLAEKEITMYGAAWCTHCQKEKKGFGEAFKYVPYVECPNNPNKCLEMKVNGYPTWIFPDGKRLEGEQGVDKLAAESGCSID